MYSPRFARFAFWTGVVTASLTAACAPAGPTTGEASAEIESTSGPLARAFVLAGNEAGVPRDLLVAISVVEEALTFPALRPDLDEDNEVPAAGPLQLRRGKIDTLARGAALVSASELTLRRDGDLALRAGALVLAELGNARADDSLAAWADAVGAMSGFADEAHRDRYVHDVYRILASGGSFVGRDGETIVVAPHDVPPALVLDVSSKITMLSTETAEFPTAEWIPTSCTNKCNLTREGAIGFILIHDTEGSWNASVATLQNDPNKSAHYIVGQDGRVGQFVTESVNAWHAGNGHYNNRSVGIEHVGWYNQPFPTPLYEASAKLTSYLANKYSVPKDCAHVIGHDQVPNGKRIAQSSAACSQSPKACQNDLNYGGASKHVDPGVFEWATFMPRFGGKAKCNDVTAILNCSKDKTAAFRCVDGEVEVLPCVSCTVMSVGQDDACTPPPAPAPQTQGSDAGTAPSEEPAAQTTAPPPLSLDEAALPADPGDPGAAGATDSGCGVASGSSGSSGASNTFVAVMLGLGLTVARRRRRRD